MARFHDRVAEVAGSISSTYGEPPNAQVREEIGALTAELRRHLDDFNQLIKTDIAAYNQEAYRSGAPTLYAGEPIVVRKDAAI